MDLVVSIPTYRTPPRLLARAVSTVLGSRDVDVHAIVVVDGPQPELRLEPRPGLTVFHLDTNRGRYYADAVVTRAMANLPPGTYWSPHDSDDWSEPGRYAEVLDAARAGHGAAVAPYWRHPRRGETIAGSPDPRRREVRTDLIRSLPTSLRHIVHWSSGVYSVARLGRAPLHPGFRIGYDTLHTLLVARTGSLRVADSAGYHWVRRNGSLTTASATAPGSAERNRARRELSSLWDLARSSTDPARAVLRHRLAAPLDEVLEHDVDRLRRQTGWTT